MAFSFNTPARLFCRNSCQAFPNYVSSFSSSGLQSILISVWFWVGLGVSRKQNKYRSVYQGQTHNYIIFLGCRRKGFLLLACLPNWTRGWLADATFACSFTCRYFLCSVKVKQIHFSWASSDRLSLRDYWKGHFFFWGKRFLSMVCFFSVAWQRTRNDFFLVMISLLHSFSNERFFFCQGFLSQCFPSWCKYHYPRLAV